MPSHQFHMLGNLRLTIKEADYKALNSNTVQKDTQRPPEEPYKPNMPNTEATDPYKAPEVILAWTEKQGPTHDLYSDPRSVKESDHSMCR